MQSKTSEAAKRPKQRSKRPARIRFTGSLSGIVAATLLIGGASALHAEGGLTGVMKRVAHRSHPRNAMTAAPAAPLIGGPGGFGDPNGNPDETFDGDAPPPPPGGPGDGPAEITHLPFALLTTQLHLTDAQQGRIAVLLLQARDADAPPAPPRDRDGRREGDPRETHRAAEAAARKKVEAELTGSQPARLASLLAAMRTLQTAGVPPPVSAKLDLSSHEIETLARAAPAETAADKKRDSDTPPAPQDRKAAVQSARSALQAALTASQRGQITPFVTGDVGPRAGELGDRGGPPPPPDRPDGAEAGW